MAVTVRYMDFRPSQPPWRDRYMMPVSGTDRYFNVLHRLDRYDRYDRYKNRDLCSKRSFFAFKGPFIVKNDAKMLLFWT